MYITHDDILLMIYILEEVEITTSKDMFSIARLLFLISVNIPGRSWYEAFFASISISNI